MIFFDNAGDNVTLTLYNVMLSSQKLCLKHNNKCDCNKTNGVNELYVVVVFFPIKYRYSDILLKKHNFNLSAD